DAFILWVERFISNPGCIEASLQVRMSEKCDGDSGLLQRCFRFFCVDYILVLVQWRAMNKLRVGNLFHANGALRQSTQPIHVFGSELIAGPESSQTGDRIEIFQIG